MGEVKKKILWKVMTGCLLVIIFFTLFSRAVHNATIATVITGEVKRGSIAHTVSAMGTVVQNGEQALVVEEGLLIARILVAEGEAVEKGQPLLKVDMSSLEEAVTEYQEEIRKLELQNQEVKSQEAKEQENAEKNYQAAQDAYTKTVAEQESIVQNAWNELEEAKAQLQALKEAQNEQEELNQKEQTDYQEQIATLEAGVTEKQTLYDSAVAAKNSVVAEAYSNVENSEITIVSSTQPQQNQISIEQLQRTLGKLEELQEENGYVYAVESGYVKEIRCRVGELTTGTAALTWTSLSEEMQVVGTFAKEDAKYLSIGGKVQVKTEYQIEKKDALEDLTIQLISQKTDGEEGYEVIVSLPQNVLPLGAGVELVVTAESEIYENCIEKSALYQDGANEYFVYVVEEADTILGKENVASKVSVELLDSNETKAAVDGIYSGQEIILQSSRELEHKNVIKVQE